MRFLAALALTLLAAPALAQEGAARVVATDTPLRLDAMLAEVVIPGFDAFAARADALPVALDTLCATPSEANIEGARAAFSDAVLFFARVEFIRIGPLMEENRSERLLFWPDRKGISLRQIQAIIAEADESATDVATLSGKSVAVQGLGALEFVLYGTGFETLATPEGDFRCRFGAAIADNISAIAGELSTGWHDPEGIALRLTQPLADYADYRTPLEALEEGVGLVAHGVEAIKDQRLLPFIALDGKPARPRMALFWRSGLTMASLRANVEGMEALLAAIHYEAALAEKDKSLPGSIAFEFHNAYRAFDLVKDQPEAAVADARQAQALNYLGIVLKSLQAVVGENLAFGLGLSVGFSSLDRD